MASKRNPEQDKELIHENSTSVEGDILDKVPPEDRKFIASMFSGPLPHPDDFNKYPQEVQKSIVKDASSQISHRHLIENKVTDTDAFAVKVGVVGTFVIYVLCIAGALYMFSVGNMLAGIFLGLPPTLGKTLSAFRNNR